MTAAGWPIDELEAVPACPVCGGCERTVLHAGLSDLAFGVAPGRWTLYRCARCQSGWLDPRPTQASIGMAYVNYYTHSGPDDPVRQKSALIRQLHRWLDDYQNACYGLKRTSAIPMGRWLVPLVPSLRAKAQAKWRHLQRPPAGGGRLLDFGFGDGEFLRFASAVGWNAEGIDFDPETVRRAQASGLNVRCGSSAADISDENAPYDVITLSHVVEHMHDPCGLLSRLYQLLKPGGRLWLETPNIDSCGSSRFGRNWRGLEPPRHLTIFNLSSLRLALQKAGFENVREYWHGMSALSMYAESLALARRENLHNVRLPLLSSFGALLFELIEVLRPEKREFLSLIACK